MDAFAPKITMEMALRAARLDQEAAQLQARLLRLECAVAADLIKRQQGVVDAAITLLQNLWDVQIDDMPDAIRYFSQVPEAIALRDAILACGYDQKEE